MTAEPEIDQPADKDRTFSVLRVIVLVVVGALIGAAILMNSRSDEPQEPPHATPHLTPAQTVLRSFALPPDQRKPALERLESVRAEVEAGRLSEAQYRRVLEQLDQSPLKDVVGHDVLIRKYVQSPKLTPELRQRGDMARMRYLRGLHEGSIHPQTMNDVLSPVRQKHGDEVVSLDPDPAAEQIEQMIANLEKHADGAEIASERFELDYAAALLAEVENAIATARSE